MNVVANTLAKGMRQVSRWICVFSWLAVGCAAGGATVSRQHFGKGYEASLEVDLCAQLAGGCSRGATVVAAGGATVVAAGGATVSRHHFGKGYEAILEVDLCAQLAGGGVCSRGGKGEQATLWQRV